VYRPSPSVPGPGAVRAPLLRRDTVGTFEARLRWSARWRWLAPLLVVLGVVAGVAGWLFLLRGRPDPAAGQARGAALALVALDDAASLDQALARLDEILQRAPNHTGAAADRALAQVLRAAALVEDGEGLASRSAARAAERERLRRDQPPGWEDAERAAAADVQKLEPEVRVREERARALGGAAFQTLRKLQASAGDSPEVARGLAAYYALGGERDRARKVVRAARERAPADPWLDLAEAWADARDPDRAVRERALVQLGALAAAHPELVRARFLLARTEAALGRRDEALSTLDALLASNGRHEAGRRLRDELVRPPPPAPSPPPAAPPPAKPPTPPRRIVAQPPAPPAVVPEPAVPPQVPEPAAEWPGEKAAPPAPGSATGSAPAPVEGAATPAASPPPPPAGPDVTAHPPPARPARQAPVTGPDEGG
jgi:tetratricopeptide (TPR) repeat protein